MALLERSIIREGSVRRYIPEACISIAEFRLTAPGMEVVQPRPLFPMNARQGELLGSCSGKLVLHGFSVVGALG
jgi:hypothetical protein